MAEKDLKALFVHQLKDTNFAENVILMAPCSPGPSSWGSRKRRV
ncbi:MAG TPA: hypothetical protein VKA90_01830 [Beijerinckiaceae bacterium]|jgi:hypothetical protein|nr:hypothetical protein [Beijerinckiaceae bacterium]